MTRPRSRIAAFALAAAMLAAAGSAHALGALGFFFVNQALGRLGSGAWSLILGAGRAPAAPGPPSWAASLGAAELINEKLPLEAGDGFAFLSARAPAPGALEVLATAPPGAEPAAAELDLAWGPGLAELFCGSEPTLWTRWIAIGGSVGLEVRSARGELIRRYGVARSDCAALAARR